MRFKTACLGSHSLPATSSPNRNGIQSGDTCTGVRHNTKYNAFLLMQYRIRDPCIWYKHKRHLRFLSLFLKGYYHSTYYKSDAPSVKPINQIMEHIVKKKLLMATFGFFYFILFFGTNGIQKSLFVVHVWPRSLSPEKNISE